MASACGRGRALARIGLVGHPSDGYGGATLGVTLRNFAAAVTATPAPVLDIAPDGDDQWPEGGAPLVAATVERFARERGPSHSSYRIRYRSTIPREVGLGGSSALVIATLRALAGLTRATIPDEELAALALAVETEELGIAAGPQDRVVQTYEGLVFMDFASGRYERLASALMPEIFVAWHPEAGESSGAAHAAVRARFEQGDTKIVSAMRNLAQLAHDARAALQADDHAAFSHALAAGHDVRKRIFALDPRHTAMIDEARALGLAATYTGSGGAIAGIASDPDVVAELERRLHSHGVRLEPALI